MGENRVLIKNGRNSSVYHRPDGLNPDTPACVVTWHDCPEEWREWGIEKAQAWKSPCQNPRCYGDQQDHKQGGTGKAD